MKLIIAIVQDEDAGRLMTSIMNEGFSVTKLATTGGFLKAGNTTLLIGFESERLDQAIGIIEKTCKSRKQISTAPSPVPNSSGGYLPVEVVVGGATVFVMDVDQFKKF